MLVGDFIRVYCDERTNFNKGVSYYTIDSKKQEGIKCCLQVLRHSAPKLIKAKHFGSLFRVVDTMPTDVPAEYIINLDDFHSKEEDEKINTRVANTRDENVFVIDILTKQLENLNQLKISTFIYDGRVISFYNLKKTQKMKLKD